MTGPRSVTLRGRAFPAMATVAKGLSSAGPRTRARRSIPAKTTPRAAAAAEPAIGDIRSARAVGWLSAIAAARSSGTTTIRVIRIAA